MEFIPRKPAAAQAASGGPAIDSRRRAIRDAGVAAVAAALGLAEGVGDHAHAHPPVPHPLPKAA